ncbi:MAG: Tol-Pal system subunit TolQ [Rickettsiales bacterium]|nr:Tol-Pal system subunit TolQ [Rickettsiales bacterium]|tara:strand:- start:11412 stop:12149 length:738 start_codon:yes stop_codon:yes gene_type:complete
MVNTASGQVVENIAYQADSHSFFQLFIGAEWVVQLIMLGLLLTSITTWALIISKARFLNKLKKSIKSFEFYFWQNQEKKSVDQLSLPSETPFIYKKFLSVLRQETKLIDEVQKKENSRMVSLFQNRLERAYGIDIRQEIDGLSSGLTFLATVGSSALFVGLFGTVWGIIHSFQSIAASKNTSLAVVAPGIAEALLATALGLIVAIPAVIAFNKFSAMIDRIAGSYENFADQLIVVSGQEILQAKQ